MKKFVFTEYIILGVLVLEQILSKTFTCFVNLEINLGNKPVWITELTQQ